MRVKTSLTLSRDLIEAIDGQVGSSRSRSEFVEASLRSFLAQMARKEAERKDLEAINRHADRLNQEARDVLHYQAIP